MFSRHIGFSDVFLEWLCYFYSSISQRVGDVSVEWDKFLVFRSLTYGVLNMSPIVRNEIGLRANYELAFLRWDLRRFYATWSSPIHFLHTLHVFLEVAHARSLLFLRVIMSLCRWEQVEQDGVTRDRTCVNHDVIAVCRRIIEEIIWDLLIVKASWVAHIFLATDRVFGIRPLGVVKSAQNLLWQADVIVLLLGTLL